ncbi:MAG: ribonuclease H-like domain-containing protein [Chloroflexota bacterium]
MPHDISALSGLSKQAQDNLRRAGLNTMQQIASLTPTDLQRIKGIKTSAPGVHAHARAFVEDRPIWYGSLPNECLPLGYMFDLETDPYTQAPWSWGWCDTDGTPHMAIVAARRPESEVKLPDGRVVFVVPHQSDAWHLFAQAVSAAEENSLIFHWTGFDSGVTRTNAPAAVREPLLERMHDLHRTFKGSVKFPVSGNSLKTVGRYLGFHWQEYEAWDACYNDYRLWLAKGDVEALARAANYQQADVEALIVVWRWLIENRQP